MKNGDAIGIYNRLDNKQESISRRQCENSAQWLATYKFVIGLDALHDEPDASWTHEGFPLRCVRGIYSSKMRDPVHTRSLGVTYVGSIVDMLLRGVASQHGVGKNYKAAKLARIRPKGRGRQTEEETDVGLRLLSSSLPQLCCDLGQPPRVKFEVHSQNCPSLPRPLPVLPDLSGDP